MIDENGNYIHRYLYTSTLQSNTIACNEIYKFTLFLIHVMHAAVAIGTLSIKFIYRINYLISSKNIEIKHNENEGL